MQGFQAGAGPDVEAVCYGTNEVLGGDSVALVHNLEIISPPGVPTISGVQPHSSVQVWQMMGRENNVPTIYSRFCPSAPELLNQCWPAARPAVLVPGQGDDGLALHGRRGHRLRRHHLRAQPHGRGGADMRGFQRRIVGANKEHDHNPVVNDLIFHYVGFDDNCDKFKHRELDKTP